MQTSHDNESETKLGRSAAAADGWRLAGRVQRWPRGFRWHADLPQPAGISLGLAHHGAGRHFDPGFGFDPERRVVTAIEKFQFSCD